MNYKDRTTVTIGGDAEPKGRPARGRVVGMRLYATLLILIALPLIAGGLELVMLDGSYYYVLAGIGVLASGILVWCRRVEGALLFGAMFLATLAWALWEVGTDGWLLMPRLVGPAVLAVVLLLPLVRLHLIWPAYLTEWRSRGILLVPASVVCAVLLGLALHAVKAPDPLDPLYQRGMGAPAAATLAATSNNGDWSHFGNSAGGTRFSPLTQIDAGNVGKLKVAWTFRAGDALSGVTPIKIQDSLYFCTGSNQIISLDAETGKQRWRFDPHTNQNVFMKTCRGVAYYKIPDAQGECAERIYTNTIDARLLSVSAQTGRPCGGFGERGQVSLLSGMGPNARNYYHVTSAPTIVKGVIVLGGWVRDGERWTEPSGVIRAYDAVSGRLAWAFDVGHPDRQGEPPAGETYTPSTPNAWGPMSADEALGLVYAPTGSATGADVYGPVRRPFDERYSSSVVAIDVHTGKPRWTFQTTHHDLWDWDVGSQPVLIDIQRLGVIRRALIQPTKRGEIFLLDRETGQPLSPVQELPVPQRGALPEERLSPTQPFSTGLPSFRGADLVESDMWGITPLDQLWCRLEFKKARYEGTATPPGTTPAIIFPGDLGAVNWGSVSVDQDRQLMIVNSNRIAYRGRLIPRAEADRMGIRDHIEGSPLNRYSAQANTPYASDMMPFLSPFGLLCQAPPYGRISAVDLNSGKLVWTHRIGSAAANGPFGLPSMLPFTIGTPTMGGTITTRSRLVFVGAATDPFLRAFDATNGKLLWQGTLPRSAQTTPMTYLSKGGRQFVVIAAGGSKSLNTPVGDYVVAFALPH